QMFKSDLSGKALSDNVKLEDLKLSDGGSLYFKDLGPQIGYTTVFILEYLGPLLIYPIFLLFPQFIYGEEFKEHHWIVRAAAACWTFHYTKRILETIFVHRFSHGTMPFGNLYRNCGYYWSFAAFISYFVNHPLFHPPSFGHIQAFIAIGVFIFSQIGNFSIHIALSNLR
ncbi:hypothetical protein, partial [Salmonella sp. s51228]|uniref:hypothetical protein n=1 Tax=Salmonella sp. s51228 TaxID=3159652 RepID=UPI00397EBE77